MTHALMGEYEGRNRGQREEGRVASGGWRVAVRVEGEGRGSRVDGRG